MLMVKCVFNLLYLILISGILSVEIGVWVQVVIVLIEDQTGWYLGSFKVQN